MHYILNPDGSVRQVPILFWAKWFESNPGAHIIQQTEVSGVKVSTVFLEIDHGFQSGVPILFETRVFGGALDETQERYGTIDEARKGHAAMVEAVRKELASAL